MRTWRRLYREGGTYFFTVVTHDRWPCFDRIDRVRKLGDALRIVRERHPFGTAAIVVLPDHLHCIWTLPANDADFSLRWQLVKKQFARDLRGGQRIWQPRFWEHLIRDEDDMARHMDYIHYNPVKHGLSASAAAWPHSSFARHVRNGLYAPMWGSSMPANVRDMDIE